MSIDDLTLVRRSSEGDQRAFRLLVERYQRKVYSLALGMLKDPDLARDAAQEAFLKVFRYLARFNGAASFYTWIYRITVNICIDTMRRNGVHEDRDAEEFDELVAKDAAFEPPSYGDPHRALQRRELNEQLTAALATLPKTHRQILLLREIDGMSYSDLSRTLNIPKGTVMSRLFHARLKVQKHLKEYVEGKGN